MNRPCVPAIDWPRRSVIAFGVAVSLVAGTAAVSALPGSIARATTPAPSSLDTSFNGTGQVATPVGDGGGGKAVVLDGGDYVVVGMGTGDDGTAVVKVARYTPAGALDDTFGDAGIATLLNTDFDDNVFLADAVALQPGTGDIIVAGSVVDPTSDTGNDPNTGWPFGHFGAFRLRPDGTLDATFAGGTGYVDTAVGDGADAVSAIAVDGAGDIFLAGLTDADTTPQAATSAYDADGAVRTGYGTGGQVILATTGTAGFGALAVDGTALVAAGQDDGMALVARFASDGKPDPTFGGGTAQVYQFSGTYSGANAVLVEPDHSIVLAGSGLFTVNGTPTECLAIAKVTADGSDLDASFGDHGVGHVCAGDDSNGSSLAASPDGTEFYVAGSSFTNSDSLTHFLLARFTSAGVADSGFGSGGAVTSEPAGTGAPAQAFGLAMDGNKPVVSGTAFTITGTSASYFAVERYVGDPMAGPPVMTARPSISGPITTGSSLTGSPGSWTGTVNSYDYQWMRCTSPPADGATACPEPQPGDGPVQEHSTSAATDSYILTSDDAGKYLVLVVSAANDAGAAAGVSPVFDAFAVSNTSAPVVTGAPEAGAPLTGTHGTWMGSIALYDYFWLRCTSRPSDSTCPTGWTNLQKTKLDAATPADTYTVQDDDLGTYVVLKVRAQTPSGARTAYVSSAPFLVAPPTATSAPVISGNAAVGATLTGSAGTWSGAPTTFVYLWVRCTAVPTPGSEQGICGPNQPAGDGVVQNDDVPATQTTDPYTVTQADEGKYLVLEVRGVTDSDATTAYSEPIVVAATVNTAPPGISGYPEVGRTLTGSPGGWTGATHLVYEWVRCTNRPDYDSNVCPDAQPGDGVVQNDSLPVASTDTYTLTQNDIGRYFVLEVKGVNGGSSVRALSAVFEAMPAPVNTEQPSIDGSAFVGHTLTGRPGAWGFSPTGYVYKWIRCTAVPTPGSTSGVCGPNQPGSDGTVQVDDRSPNAASDGYAISQADTGKYLILEVLGVNNSGYVAAWSWNVVHVQAASVDAMLTADSTSGTAPFTVHLDASRSVAPPGATFQFFCGDSDVPTGAAGNSSTATCTYDRGSPSGGWDAFVRMHDPATGRNYQDSVPIHVAPKPDTIDDSAAFPGDPAMQITVADDGSLASHTCRTGHPYTYCTGLGGASLSLQALPGTFAPGTVIAVYAGDSKTLQSEIGDVGIVQGGFAVTWTPRVPLVQPLILSIHDTPQVNVVPAFTGGQRRLRPFDAVSATWGFLTGIGQGISDFGHAVVSTIGNAVSTVGTAIGDAFGSAQQVVDRPNGSATNDVVYCPGGVDKAGATYTCNGLFTELRDLPTDEMASLTAGTHVIAAGGGNVIAAGGGNVIAAGGGNVIAAGGGNVIAAGGGNLVLISAGVIAAGGGNVIAAGGGNVIAAGGGNVIAAGGGNVIAAGGGNFTLIAGLDPGFGVVEPNQTTPPTVTGTSQPPAPASGTYPVGSSVTVHLQATAAHGATVKAIGYSASGDQPVDNTVVPGSSADVTIDTPGRTILTYSALDSDLNWAPQQTVTVTIAAPAAAGTGETGGSAGPAPGGGHPSPPPVAPTGPVSCPNHPQDLCYTFAPTTAAQSVSTDHTLVTVPAGTGPVAVQGSDNLVRSATPVHVTVTGAHNRVVVPVGSVVHVQGEGNVIVADYSRIVVAPGAVVIVDGDGDTIVAAPQGASSGVRSLSAQLSAFLQRVLVAEPDRLGSIVLVHGAHDRVRLGSGADQVAVEGNHDTVATHGGGDYVVVGAVPSTATVLEAAYRAAVSHAPAMAPMHTRIRTGPGRDTAIGGAAGDVLRGGRGDDVLRGRAGPDRLHGGSGDDHLWGGAGADVLRDGSGVDHDRGGQGHDTVIR